MERARSGLAASTVLTVSQLARRIQGVIEQGLGEIWVVGEVSNFRLASSGHCYFTLKDEQAQVSAVLFRSAAARLRFRPTDGLEVIARGRIGLYENRGALQLYVESLEPRGVGALRLQLEQLRGKLAAEGLLDPERKRPLPFLPRCVGIVTALGGAALQDILTMLRSRHPGLRIVVRPVRVQGVGAEAEIAAGIHDLQAVADLDVMIVGRGGGSIEDLWAFNDEGVARAIVAARVPVVSAVGHEIDVTIADLVADARAPTPTAAAEMVVPRRADLLSRVGDDLRAVVSGLRRAIERRRRAVAAFRSRLRDPRRDLIAARSRAAEIRARLLRAVARRLEDSRDSVSGIEQRLRLGAPQRRITDHRAGLGHAERRLASAMRHRAEIARERLAGLVASLSSLSPLAVLERGYSLVWKQGEARALRSAAEVATGDGLRIRLHRGWLGARVESRQLEGDEPKPKDGK